MTSHGGFIPGVLLGVAKVNFSSKTTTGASRVWSYTLPTSYGKGGTNICGAGSKCWQIIYTGGCFLALFAFCQA